MDRVLAPEPGEAIETGEKLVVTPAGAPETESATAELRVELAAVVNRTVPVLLAATVTPLADGVRVKDGGNGDTTKLTGTVRVTFAAVAVIVSGYVPATAAEVTCSVNRSLPKVGPRRVGAAKVGLTPAGKPLTDRVSVELNAPCGVAVTFRELELPATTVILLALAASLNPITVMVKVAVFVASSPSAVIVKG
jgi:hypothetical protein